MPQHPRRPILRCGGAAAAAALIVLATSAAAAAHVRVESQDATQGGYGVLTFRVPTESATASTTSIHITFPAKDPIASASVQPVAGWTATVATKPLATPITTDDGQLTTYVSDITWTSDGPASAIKPGEFQQFAISAGPLPKAAEVSFPTEQVYSDGSTVDWNEVATGSAEPEHPAPTLALARAAAPPAASTSAARPAAAPMTMSDTDGSTPAWPGIVGLVAGILGLVVGSAALARSRRPGDAS